MYSLFILYLITHKGYFRFFIHSLTSNKPCFIPIPSSKSNNSCKILKNLSSTSVPNLTLTSFLLLPPKYLKISTILSASNIPSIFLPVPISYNFPSYFLSPNVSKNKKIGFE